MLQCSLIHDTVFIDVLSYIIILYDILLIFSHHIFKKSVYWRRLRRWKFEKTNSQIISTMVIRPLIPQVIVSLSLYTSIPQVQFYLYSFYIFIFFCDCAWLYVRVVYIFLLLIQEPVLLSVIPLDSFITLSGSIFFQFY